MKIGTKLNAAFFAITLLLIISTVVSFVNLKHIQTNANEALSNRVKQIQLVDNIRAHIGMQGMYVRELVMNPTDANKETLVNYSSTLEEDIKALSDIQLSKRMNKYLDEFKYYNDEFNTGLDKIYADVEQGDLTAASKIIKVDLLGASYGILNTADNTIAYQNKELAIIEYKTALSIYKSIITSGILSLLSIIVTIISIIIVRKQITRPLHKVMNAAEHLANGDLTVENLNLKQKDEIGQLSKIFDQLKNHLNSLIHSIQENAEQLSSSSEELAAGTEEITAASIDVNKQLETAVELAGSAKSNSEETAQAMHETAKGIQNIAEASNILQTTSLNANSTANEGKHTLTSAQNQMININKSTYSVNELVINLSKQTNEIDRIVKVISDITDQTNLLALNASIEAARAGEHGKGFAVVADEVKKLAEQSKQSATMISTLITSIQQDSKNVEIAVQDAIHSVDDGVDIITKAGKSFDTIVYEMNEMTKQIEEISATSEQLFASTVQVTEAVAEIANGSNTTSSNLVTIASAMEEQSAIMHEINNVATTLTNNAQDLTDEAKQFKVRK